MREVPVASLGTYYTPSSPHAGANADPMRGLVYLAKNNRPDVSGRSLFHPDLPPRYLQNPGAAYKYVAELFAGQWSQVLQSLKLSSSQKLVLVPIPSSEATLEAAHANCRWPAARMAKELSKKGLGSARICLLQHQPTKAKVEGGHLEAHEIAANFQVYQNIEDNEVALFVDDVITWGKHIAAADHALLGGEGRSAGIMIAATGWYEIDAYERRSCAVRYDVSREPWAVTIDDM